VIILLFVSVVEVQYQTRVQTNKSLNNSTNFTM
jgi:hypothetical protein